jgi:hypothetical protein
MILKNVQVKAGFCHVVKSLFHKPAMANTNGTKVEENPKNKQFYEKVAEFYGDLKGADKESRNWSFMYRYYVFQKMD